MTPAQSRVLELIKQHIREYGAPPTRMEIAHHFGYRSPNTAEEHLRALARKGAVELIPHISRGIRVVGAA